jgi:hypothetical protein
LVNINLLVTITRIPRYILLLDALFKRTDPEHPDYNDLRSAIELIQNVADHVNEGMKEAQRMAALLEIEQKFGYTLVRCLFLFLFGGFDTNAHFDRVEIDEAYTQVGEGGFPWEDHVYYCGISAVLPLLGRYDLCLRNIGRIYIKGND